MDINYYELYQYNIWSLINNYKLEYHWWNPCEINWYTDDVSDWSKSWNKDPWLLGYQNEQHLLAKDLVDNGSFTPIFYKELFGKIFISLGRHRVWALNLINFPKKFLFIKITDGQIFKEYNKNFVYFNKNNLKLIRPFKVYDILNETGDFLTHWLWKNNCTPFLPFNNEEEFENWIKTPLATPNIIENRVNSLSHIQRIDLEFQSYCNRKCDWCPNKEYDRLNTNFVLDKIDFLKLLYELKDSRYAKSFSLTGYQEIFSNPILAQSYIIDIHHFFPNAHITGASNGDFITKFALNKIDLNYLLIDDYDCKGLEYWKNKCYELSIKIKHFDEFHIIGEHPNIQTVFIKLNWPKTVQLENRGGFFNPGDLPNYLWKNNMEPRVIPCAEPTYYLNISYDGSVMPCCHMRPDNPEHQQYILGNIKDQSIIEIYYSEKAQNFREQVRTRNNNNLPEPCKRCHKYRDGKISGSPDGWTYKGLEYYKQHPKEI